MVEQQAWGKAALLVLFVNLTIFLNSQCVGTVFSIKHYSVKGQRGGKQTDITQREVILRITGKKTSSSC